MTDLLASTGTGTESPLREAFGALQIIEVPNLALASLALPKGQAAPTPLGLELPECGRWVGQAGQGAFWTGPGQWMLEAEGRGGEDFATAVTSAAPGCAVTEQSGGWISFGILSSQGAAPIEALLRRLVNLDPRNLGPGAATRGELAHMSVFLIRRSEDRLAVIGPSSFAESLWLALTAAARVLESRR